MCVKYIDRHKVVTISEPKFRSRRSVDWDRIENALKCEIGNS